MEVNQILNTYIVQIGAPEPFGHGVIINDLLITAGHVLDEFDETKLVVQGNEFLLRSDSPLCEGTRNPMNPNDYDIAVFRLNGVHSPISLADSLPEENQELSSMYYKSYKNSIFDYGFTLKQSVSIVNKFYGNFFSCRSLSLLYKGESGCPIFYTGKVYGILSKGPDPKNRKGFADDYLYLSSTAIFDFLQKNGIRI